MGLELGYNGWGGGGVTLSYRLQIGEGFICFKKYIGKNLRLIHQSSTKSVTYANACLVIKGIS